MFTNPFSPIFGGKPSVFFGRDDILYLFETAMRDPGSDDRAMFITGTRGSGKTALLEQFSIRADDRKRRVIDLGPDETVAQLIRELAGYDETTGVISPQANISILGTGGGISAGSVSKTKHPEKKDLQPLMLEACKKEKKGILVTIDEIQKVPIEDVSSICNAFQMASRKGCDIMLAAAGLPYAFAKITRHEGCTYLRRSSHVELGLFTWDEADEALHMIFSEIKGLQIEQSCIDRLNKISYGHPYLLQLLGYYLVLQVNSNDPGRKYKVTEQDIDESAKSALYAYEMRALKPLLEELPDSEEKYLMQMSKCLDEDRMARTSDIAKGLDIQQNKLSRIRGNLIDHGIIAAPERGKVMFCIPYLADYVKKDTGVSNAVEVARQRRV